MKLAKVEQLVFYFIGGLYLLILIYGEKIEALIFLILMFMMMIYIRLRTIREAIYEIKN